ncbi:ABC transporter permease [Schaalia hyovaginalis]|uniref:ABC transporter permease n=1 Tax=Schaalia hyovaginalis TaxID=29316 RepID=UPI0012B394E7|nr:ABC transporter permease [Schaalia hyovaginalis]MDY3666175.1 ABC transporter permease [Schaalia hyovaginalis]MST64203.1 ABC transporter permease [Schaalia hyovaginalis]
MARFMLKRLGQAIVVVFLVTIIAFILLHSLPGGAARATLGKEATQEQIEQFNHENGFDLPLHVQYVHYVEKIAHGDFGYSYKLNQTVSDAISQRLPKTILLSLISTILAILIAVPLGVWQAVRRNKAPDYVVTLAALLAYSTPIFFLGLLLIILFSQVWPVLPPEAPQGFTVGEMFTNPKALILPVVTLAIVTIASYSRYIRSSMVDNLNEQYVRTARSKGLSEFRIVFVHTLRNALFPVITLLGLYIPALFSGALVIETLFNFNGMGLLFWQSAQSRDYPILLGVTIILSIATVIGALLADFLYAVADPRIRLAAH